MSENTRIAGLVNTQKLSDFTIAAKALFSDLAFGEDEFDREEIQNFMMGRLRESMLWAESDGPNNVQDPSWLPDAVAYVKRYVTTGGTKVCVAIEWAKNLYDLDNEAVQLLKQELDTTWSLT